MRIWKAKPLMSEDLLTQLLSLRGLHSPPEIEAFLDVRYERSADPYLLAGLQAAVDRIKGAVDRREKITVYADYDADAVTAAAVILRFLRAVGHQDAGFYIPDRFTEGYGLNPEAIAALAKNGTKLLLTVDCGTNAVEAVKLAKDLGMDVVITDHHQLTGSLPEAVAVVNPHRPDDHSLFKDLTGVGVAFKLVQAMVRATGDKRLAIRDGWEKWLLDLVAIGTVADCQNLLGENRIFVKWGLVVLGKTRWIGLRELLKLAGIWNEPLDTYKIGFVIAPRINAAGRIEHADLALKLLLTDDAAEARTLAQKLEDLNRHRQELTGQILSEAREQILTKATNKILLVAGKNWPKGIVGLVAGKLTEEFYRPVLAIDLGEKEATGSARSIRSFNIVEALSYQSELLVRFGGHPMAAGFTLLSEHVETFHQKLLEHAETVLSEEDLSPVLYYDAEITLGEITPELLKSLAKFAPFGQGNPRPLFRFNKLAPRYPAAIGEEGKHLRLYVSSQSSSPPAGEELKERGISFSCIGFNLGFWAEKLRNSALVDVICEPQWNEWNGKRSIQLKIIDLDYSNGR